MAKLANSLPVLALEAPDSVDESPGQSDGELLSTYLGFSLISEQLGGEMSPSLAAHGIVDSTGV